MEKSFEELLAIEQNNLELVKQKYLSLFNREPQIDTRDILKRIGISVLHEDRPVGYIKLWPQDFIVEEIDQNEKLHSVGSGEITTPDDNPDGKTIYADLVKVGLSTIEVQRILAEMLEIDEGAVGSAGIKDKDALTAQALSFRNIEKEPVQNIQHDHFFLKNIYQGKGVVGPGMLKGNRFTLVIRTPKPVPPEDLDAFMEDVRAHGFWNFYYLQRFGTPRLLTHHWGLAIIRGEYEKAVRIMLTGQGVRELPLYKEVRSWALEHWGDWEKMSEIFSSFPLTFRTDCDILAALSETNSDFKAALASVPQQTQLGVYAYSSLLFNVLLSKYIVSGKEPPKELPLVLSTNPRSQAPYQEFLNKHGVKLPSPAMRDSYY